MIGVIDVAPAPSLTTTPLTVGAPQSVSLVARAGHGVRRIAVFLFELLTNVG